jgi:hypothetical protein
VQAKDALAIHSAGAAAAASQRRSVSAAIRRLERCLGIHRMGGAIKLTARTAGPDAVDQSRLDRHTPSARTANSLPEAAADDHHLAGGPSPGEDQRTRHQTIGWR